jgi:hypothetical protein
MDKDIIIEIVNNVKDKPNKDLLECEYVLFNEYETTKQIIVELMNHMELIEGMHSKIVFEIENRKNL